MDDFKSLIYEENEDFTEKPSLKIFGLKEPLRPCNFEILFLFRKASSKDWNLSVTKNNYLRICLAL